MGLVTFMCAVVMVSYIVLVNIKCVTILDSGFEFKDLNETIILMGLARTEVVETKFLKIVTDHFSHYNTFVITEKGAYLLSPVGKMLYIIKIRPEDIKYDGIKVESWNESFSIDALYKPDVPITLLKYCEYYMKECNKQTYNRLYNNCHHTTLNSLRAFVHEFSQPLVEGFDLIWLVLRETLYTLTMALRSNVDDRKTKLKRSMQSSVNNILKNVMKNNKKRIKHVKQKGEKMFDISSINTDINSMNSAMSGISDINNGINASVKPKIDARDDININAMDNVGGNINSDKHGKNETNLLLVDSQQHS